MLLETQSFVFDDFLLDAEEKVLLRDGKPVSLTPKAFQLLFELVKNHGRLLAKDDLMEKVWADSFVEDGNLTFTIRLLRKTLGDDARNPRYIETVTKRGYRFIGDVKQIETAENNGEKFDDLEISPNNFSDADESKNYFAAAAEPDEKKDFVNSQPDKNFFSHSAFSKSFSLFGRENEIAEIENLLRRDVVRLITLTGVGGSGKTSVARFIADGRSDDFADGVFFVELAPIFNPELLTASIAKTLGVKESGENSLLDNSLNFLRERSVLLVLDNFEQILAAAPFLEQIIFSTRNLKILVTSRVALRLNIENEVIIPPLAVPPSDSSALKIAEFENYAAVQMFVERAQSVKPNFILDENNASDVAAICADLDGLPLAIELAAARIKLLEPSAILQRLENHLQILTSRANTLPARQRTMRDAITWSFDLLTGDEKELFKKLSVFTGGFTVEAAEAVCRTSEMNATEILDSLESLIENNLLQQTDENGDTRLVMLETIRQFAAEQFAENTGKEIELRTGHADFFLGFARRTERDIMGAQQTKLLRRMEADRDNFRAAMDWFEVTRNENELKLIYAITPLWMFRGSPGEGIERLSKALERNADADAAVRAKAMTSLGQIIWVKGDYARSIEVCEKSLALADEIDYRMMSALSSFFLGMAHWYHYGDDKKSTAYLDYSLQLYRELKFDSGIVFATVVLAAICQTKNDLAQAAVFLDESMSAGERSENNVARSIAMVNYGRLKFAEGDYETAKELCQESLRLREELSDLWGLVQCLEPLTAIAVSENAPRRAAKLLGAIDALLESIGARTHLIFRADHEPNHAAVRAMLDEKTFENLFVEGRRLSIKKAVALALDEQTEFREDSDFDETVFTFDRRFADKFFR